MLFRSMFSGDRSKGLQRGAGAKAQFLRWEIAGAPAAQTHVLSTLGPVTVSFFVEVAESLSNADHGVALFNAQRQLMWASAGRGLRFDRSVHVFSHSFPSLPLRPGAYQWQVSLWDNGEMLDLWDCIPEMTIATEVHQHYTDEWNGLLNLPAEFSDRTGQEASVERAPRI